MTTLVMLLLKMVEGVKVVLEDLVDLVEPIFQISLRIFLETLEVVEEVQVEEIQTIEVQT